MSDPTDDDNELKGFDLGAWDAPEPPESLADDVIVRVGGTEVGAAVPVEERRAGTPRALLIGGVAAAVLVLGVGGYALVRGARHVAPTAGSVTAEKARTLSLDGAHADLDPGTEVKWTRQGRVLHVEQRKGTASWRVDEDEQLVIDAGATVASVEATGASLRVEVQMNPTDVRIVGATAITAAAVAMVTVIVYEGHVKVRDVAQHREYVVEPGTRYSVTPPPPPVVTDDRPVVGVGPVVPNTTIADVAFDAGESVTIHDPSPPTAVQINTVFMCTEPAKVVIDGTAGNGLAMLAESDHTYEVTCDGKTVTGHVRILRDALDARIMRTRVVNVARPAAGDTWSDPLQVSGTVIEGARVTIDGIAVPVASHGRFSTNLPAAGRVTIPLRIELPTGTHYALLRAKRAEVTLDTPCDEVSCVLNNYEGACCAKFKDMPDQLDAGDISDGIMALRGKIKSCGEASMNATGKVDVFVDVLPSGSVRRVTVTHGVEPELDRCVQKAVASATFRPAMKSSTFLVPFSFNTQTAPCDADALKDKGMESVNLGKHQAALDWFEKSLACKQDVYVTQLSFMAACNSQNQAKARQYYALLPTDTQKKLKVMCDRNKVDLTDPDPNGPKGFLGVNSKPAAKILIDGVDTGLTTPIKPADLALAPGKHKVTYVIGADRFTYFVVIRSGETETMTKDLQ